MKIKKGKWTIEQQALPAEIQLVLHNPAKLVAKAVASTLLARLCRELAVQAQAGELNILSAHEVWGNTESRASVSGVEVRFEINAHSFESSGREKRTHGNVRELLPASEQI